jgi:DNA repair photolyase
MRQHRLFEDPAPSLGLQRAEEDGSFVPLSALVSPVSASRLVGIARLAADAPLVDARSDVEYRELPCRTLVSRCDSPRVPFEFQINPYRGCLLGCSYCYARYTHEFMELEEWLDFERKIFVKQGAREALIRDLRRLDLQGRSIAIGTATDPYQPAERRYRVTRGLLEVFAGRRGLSLSITTKSDLVTRDLDLLARIREGNDLHVNLTITTLHADLARRIEPRAPRPDRRLAAVRALSQGGVRVGVFLMPVLPHINDDHEDLEALIRAAGEAGASHLASQVLFLRQSAKKRFFPSLREEFPELLPGYRRLYESPRTEALAAYTEQKMAEIQLLKQQYGLTGAGRDQRDVENCPGDQLRFEEF